MISRINSYDTKKEAEEIIANTANLAQKFITSSRFADVTVWDYSKQSLFNFEEYLINTYLLPKAFKLDFTDDELEGYISYIAETLLRYDYVCLIAEKYSYKDYLKKTQTKYRICFEVGKLVRDIGDSILPAIHWRRPMVHTNVDLVIAAHRRTDPVFSPGTVDYELFAVFEKQVLDKSSFIPAHIAEKVELKLQNYGYIKSEYVPFEGEYAYSKAFAFGIVGFTFSQNQLLVSVGESADKQELVFEMLQDACEILFPLGFEIYDVMQQEWLARA